MNPLQLHDNSSHFLIRSIQQYEAMMTDICLNKRKNIGRLSEIECCFQIATHYQQILLNELKVYEFENLKDEIFFFKRIMPLYIAEIEFYGLCNYAEIFKHTLNEQGEMDIAGFFQKEQQRLEKFGKEHKQFYNYVQEKRCDMDQLWFVRLEHDRTSSAYDGLMGTYLATEKYVGMVTAEMKLLERQKE